MNDVAPPLPTIPKTLLPKDGRFGSGPTKVRPEVWDEVSAISTTVIGTSHRRSMVRALTAEMSDGLRDLYEVPQDYVVAFSNGGTHSFWDAALVSLMEGRNVFSVCGEFSSRFRDLARAAPFVDDVVTQSVEPGDGAPCTPVEDASAYAYVHNETSTGVALPVERVVTPGNEDALMLVDATSAAGAMPCDVTQTDAYYFAFQKAFGADGGMWGAFLSPAAVERARRLTTTGERWVPGTLNLAAIVEHSMLNQTLNTPSIVTMALVVSQLRWLRAQGGLSFAAKRSRRNSEHLYGWAERTTGASCFVTDPAKRSPVVCTIDFDTVDAEWLVAALKHNGVVDVDPYRKLGRNQLRIGAFPAIDFADVEALTACLDYLLERAA